VTILNIFRLIFLLTKDTFDVFLIQQKPLQKNFLYPKGVMDGESPEKFFLFRV